MPSNHQTKARRLLRGDQERERSRTHRQTKAHRILRDDQEREAVGVVIVHE